MINEKLNNELREKYNPDGSPLRDLQLHLLDILKIIDGICRRNHISYWLSSGTLLGAVRHGGFIPWDDDIDIEVYYKDRNRFIKACQKELPENLCLQYHKTEHEYYLNILKVRDTTTDIGEQVKLGSYGHFDVPYQAKGFFVDVFFEESVIPPFLYISNRLNSKILVGRFSKNIPPHLCHILFVLLQALNGLFRLISWFFADKHYLYHTYGSVFFSRRRVQCLEPFQDIKFEDLMARAPSNYDCYLHDMYGDYMALPPDIIRQSRHSKSSHGESCEL